MGLRTRIEQRLRTSATPFKENLRRTFNIHSPALFSLNGQSKNRDIFFDSIKNALEQAFPKLEVTRRKDSAHIYNLFIDIDLKPNPYHLPSIVRYKAKNILQGTNPNKGHIDLQALVRTGFEQAVGKIALMEAQNKHSSLSRDWLKHTLVTEEDSSLIDDHCSGVIKPKIAYPQNALDQYYADRAKAFQDFGLK